MRKRFRSRRQKHDKTVRPRDLIAPLFDAPWYLEINGDVRAAGVDPLDHYLSFGWQEGRRPHVLFDPAHYETQSGVGALSGENPLLHYVATGWRSGHDPHPLFATTYYLLEHPDVAAAGLEPLSHYLAKGWRTGSKPHPSFDPAWYLKAHGAHLGADDEPLTHYLKDGARLGLVPAPWVGASYRSAAGGGALSPEAWLAACGEGHRAPPRFHGETYRHFYPELGERSAQALHQHYVTVGAREGRLAGPVDHRAVALAPPAAGSAPGHRRRPAPGAGKPQYSAPLILAGLPGSGLQMVARLFAEAGLFLGESVRDRAPEMPDGGWDDGGRADGLWDDGAWCDAAIVTFHERLLAQRGETLLTATPFPLVLSTADWAFMADHAIARAIHPAWGFADPRVVYALAEWQATLNGMALLYVHRPVSACIGALRAHPGGGGREFGDAAIARHIAAGARALAFMATFKGRMRVIRHADLLANRDIVGEIRSAWRYPLADTLPHDVLDPSAAARALPSTMIADDTLLAPAHALDERFDALAAQWHA